MAARRAKATPALPGQLTHLDRGVACAGLTGTAFSAVERAQVLPKSVLELSTWAMILAQLAERTAG